MNWGRHARRVGWCVGVMLGLLACACASPRFDALTQPEPDATRLRAMRRLSLASAYYEQGQNHVAQQEVRAALQIDANYAEAYSLLGLIHQRDQAPVLAQQSFEHAIVLASSAPVNGPELAAIQHNYGWFLCEQHRFSEAQTQFDRALTQVNDPQAEKTRHAIDFCRRRASLEGPGRQNQHPPQN